MINIENTKVTGWGSAIRGARNPMNSWNRSDSAVVNKEGIESSDTIVENCGDLYFVIGQRDQQLMRSLARAGADHRKFMRMVVVYADILAPLYWWKEFDTYKIGTVANSCSTMHKIAAKEFVVADFSVDHLIGRNNEEQMRTVQNGNFVTTSPFEILRNTVGMLNECRDRYLQTKDKRWWWQLIQLLPSSYNQKRTTMMNYEVLANIYKARRNHKLDEWGVLCQWIAGLPFSELITGGAVQ